MPWTETKPGLWQRPIGENEKFIKFIGDRAHQTGREHWSVTSGATFTLNKVLDSSELSGKCMEAWCALRFKHPSIACTAENDKLTYFVPSTVSVIDWAKETFTVHGSDVSEVNVVATLQPSRYTTAHLLPTEKKVLLHFAHWRTDGYGALQLVNAFLDKLCWSVNDDNTVLPWGQEVKRLTPSIEEVLHLPITATPDIIVATKEYMKTLAHTRGAVGVALKSDRQPAPAGTQSTRFRLSETDTRAVLDACNARNISLLSAVHASCAALTYLEASPEHRDKHYTSTMRFSLRPHLPKPYCTADFAATLYTGGYMFPVPASQSWLANAKQYEEQYNTGITADFLKSRRQYAIDVLGILQKGASPSDPPQSEVDISSVGDAEALVSPQQRHGDTVLEVQDVSIGVETLTRQIYCFLWTFGGRLELSLVYNEAYYEADRAKQMVQRLGNILMTELGTVCEP
ncbi:hypothetical protein GQ43DRAFT_453451 [Delitschia confertaspora ATCC 74209]|uniref:Condensation domain-containing protein n=1 Tax=Delitschia confertaspora ATCC 74209 TaxID=1513339 RepID=A0A9P4JV70_9PLEO|nr:hypothetical protein GQ43DRAFT_453451 [Delitschia confertaspora ATCC 74209]